MNAPFSRRYSLLPPLHTGGLLSNHCEEDDDGDDGGGDDDGDIQPILYLQVIRSNNEGNGKWDDWLKLYFCQDHNDKNNC